MYAVCKTTHWPTQVECSIYCYFYNNYEQNLITSGSNQLKVYRLIKNSSLNESLNYHEDYSRNDSIIEFIDNVKLECMQTFNLGMNIESLNSLKFVGANRDSLLLAFNDAKLSIVEYDPNTHDLKTISMHYFETEDLKAGFISHIRAPLIRVDPENRCAALLVFNKSIIIIPFRKDIVVEENDEKNFSFINHQSNQSSFINKKLPVLPSYKLILNPEQYGVNIVNILDIQFLHNYYEPTLLILYEPVRTWPGRVAVRQDTVSMMTLSLDVHQRVHPHIWSINNLPFDTFAALPVPKPIGGVLIFAVNSLIHLNQGLPPYGISLNGFNDSNTSFPLKTQEGLVLSLDCCQAAFISDNKILISLKYGELYILKMHNDMTRSLRTFTFTHVASTVVATTLSKCEEGFFFIGSRLGHSLLVQYFEKTNFETKSYNNKKESTVSLSVNNLILIPGFDKTDQTEDEYLYGDEYCQKLKADENEQNSTDLLCEMDHSIIINECQRMTVEDGNFILSNNMHEGIFKIHKPSNVDKDSLYSFKLCDIIHNFGPYGSICFGEPNINLENMANYHDIDVELAATSGYFHNGSVTIMQRTIKPQVETSFKLSGCIDCWTVYGSAYYDDQDASAHKYLILSQNDSTLVFQIEQEINELDQSGFITQNSTVFAGNLGENKYILQICANSVRLLDGTRELQSFSIDIGSPIIHASIADPYSVLMSHKGAIILLCLKIDPQNGSARLIVLKPDLYTAKAQIVAQCIYKDVSGMFITKKKITETVQDLKKTVIKKQIHQATSLSLTISNLSSAATSIDEEDELLYENSAACFLNDDSSMDENKIEKDEAKIYSPNKSSETFWLFIVRDNGILEIYNLPEFKLVYLIKNSSLGLRVLVDSVQITDHSYQNHTDISTIPTTREILVCGMGLEYSRPYLFLRLDEDLFIYEIFPYFESQVENHLKIRFKKITSHYLFLKSLRFNENSFDSENPCKHKSCLRLFSNIGSYSGVFLCGAYPCWFFMTYRGELRIHNMEIDGIITSFAMFNNVNCPNGYIYFNNDEELRFATLSDCYNIDSQWLYKQVPFHRTVHYITYHLESKTYSVVTSKLINVDKIVRVGGEEKDYDIIEINSRYSPCKREMFELELLSPENWSVIPGTTVEFDEWEHITCLKNIMLSSEGTSSGLKGYITIGTNYAYGEDVTNRGRIWILDIIEVVPEPGKPLTKNKVKTVYCKDQKGPVTALCQVRGYLLSAIGQKIYIWQLKESQLIGIAFIDTQIYVHTALSLRNLILIGDIYKSISLLRYQDETRTLSLVSRDHKCLQVYACEYLIDNTQMCFVVSDSDKNIIVYAYQPDNVESLGGTRLLRRADFHLGALVSSFFRIRCRSPYKITDDRSKQAYLHRHITMFATLDGSLGYLLPISEKAYRRLLMLQNLLTVNIQHIAGLNPKSFRSIKVRRADLINPSKNILDGDLLYKFLNLSISEKIEITKKIGTSTKQIMDDLQEINWATGHF